MGEIRARGTAGDASSLFECREMRVSLRDRIAFAKQERRTKEGNEDKHVRKNGHGICVTVDVRALINMDTHIIGLDF